MKPEMTLQVMVAVLFIIIVVLICFILLKPRILTDPQIIIDLFCKLDKLKINPTTDSGYTQLKEDYSKQFNFTIKNCRIKRLIPSG